MLLTRNSFEVSGIYGTLTDDDGNQIAITLEHAFPQDDGTFAPKLNTGTHECILGEHQLDHGGPFQAYEITGVPNHKGILFHIGNYNKDSDGCCLLGQERQGDMITHSGTVFNEFMSNLNGIQTFTLTVS